MSDKNTMSGCARSIIVETVSQGAQGDSAFSQRYALTDPCHAARQRACRAPPAREDTTASLKREGGL